MDTQTFIYITLIVFIIGFLMGWAVKHYNNKIENKIFEKLVQEKDSLILRLEENLNKSNSLLNDEVKKTTKFEERLQNETNNYREKIKILEDARVNLLDSFKAMSSDALKNNNESFLKLAKSTLEAYQISAKNELEKKEKSVDHLVKPIKESLDNVDIKLKDLEKERLTSYADLNSQLKRLVEIHIPQLREETNNLVKALRQPNVRGRWGEVQLRRVVEMAGMEEHCDFEEQTSTLVEEKKYIPDLIVKLPGGKKIIVDAKAPVYSYLQAIEAKDEKEAKSLFKNYASQVKKHVTELSKKRYQHVIDEASDQVVLFLPGEIFYSSALQAEPTLIENALSQQILIATPTTLIALLKAVSYGWNQEHLSKNAKKISLLGKELYERIEIFNQHWSKVGNNLKGAVSSYNDATRSFESRLNVTAKKLKDLNITTTKQDIVNNEGVDLVPKKINIKKHS